MSSLPIVVADAETNTMLWVTRSLGRAGKKVVCIGRRPTGGLLSKYATDRILCSAEGTAYARAIALVAKQHNAAAIFAHYESTVLSMYADGVQADTVIVGCGQKMMRFATEKEEVLSFAKNIGLTIPSTIILDVGDLNRQTALDLVKSHFGKKSPLYFKATTELGIEAGPGSRYFLANNIDQDGDKAIEFAWARSKVIVQEAVPGVGCGIAGLFVDGAPVCVGGHVRLRESHLTGGVSTYCQAKVVGEAWDASVQLMKELNWTGPAMVEFKITPEGKAVFLELNPRFWGSLPLYMLSGLDIPLACYEVFVTHALHATQEMKQGTRMRHVLSDIRAIRLNRKGMMRVMELGAVVTTTPWIVHEGTFLWTDAEPFIASLIPKRLRAIYLRKHDWHES